MKKYLRIGISGLLLAIIAWRTDWSAVGAKFAELRLELCLAAAGLFIFAQVVGARRWQLFARELGFERSLPQLCAYCFIGSYFNLVLPTSVGGDVVRVVYLNANAQRKWSAFVSVLLERVSGLAVMIVFACVGVIVAPFQIAPSELPWWISASVWSIAAGAIAGLISVPLLARWPSMPEAKRQHLETINGLLRTPRLLLSTAMLSMLSQFASVLIVWCLGIGLGLEIPFAYCCMFTPLVVLLTMLPISVNGMGVREGATVLLLSPLGIRTEAAITLAVLWFSIGAAVSLIGGVLYLCGSYADVMLPQNAEPLAPAVAPLPSDGIGAGEPPIRPVP